MIKEQLAEEIENKGVEYADSINYTIPKFSDENGYCWGQVEEAYEKGALDFAEPREKRIEELEQQIEAMKCCENCKHYSASCCCNLPFDDCFELSAWELRK